MKTAAQSEIGVAMAACLLRALAALFHIFLILMSSDGISG